MENCNPLISIGMGVYNGEHFIREAIDSLLTQDYENFELIISDNSSTDNTQQICLEYVARDKRIHYYRNGVNIGAIRNFNNIFKMSHGEYFMWQAHDDYRAPNYISSCLFYLENNPNAVLCCTNVLINENGNFIESKENFSTIGMSLNQRFRRLLWNNTCAVLYGLIRTSALKKTGLIKNVIGGDNPLVAELSLMGEFYQLPVFLFKKNHINRKKNIFRKIKKQFETCMPYDNQKYFFPFTKLAIEYWKLIKNSQLRIKEKFRAFIDIILCFLIKYKIFLLDPAITIYLKLSRLRK